MQTFFTAVQRADPDIQTTERNLRSCVHCGFCLPTCPTYALTGDELDSPRGRIYLIREMLQNDTPPPPATVRHLDRCLSCLSCSTTCPSGVNYMHLIDHARAHIAKTYRRPWVERALRSLLAGLLPNPERLRILLRLARPGRRIGSLLGDKPGPPLDSVRALVDLIPASPAKEDPVTPGIYRAKARQSFRVILLTGCVQQVLRPQINTATIRFLNRHGCEVIVPPRQVCCGAITHHMGKTHATLKRVRRNLQTWSRIREHGKVDAIVSNTSGCGTMLKDYAHLLRSDMQWAQTARDMRPLMMDFIQFAAKLAVNPTNQVSAKVAYQSACSLHHGQKLVQEPFEFLARLGISAKPLSDAHICCGSAGTYSIFQPALAHRLRQNKQASIAATGADLVATGNIGCLTHLQPGLPLPIIHTAELADWATGGPSPLAG